MCRIRLGRMSGGESAKKKSKVHKSVVGGDHAKQSQKSEARDRRAELVEPHLESYNYFVKVCVQCFTKSDIVMFVSKVG
jgi:hypothetical protein